MMFNDPFDINKLSENGYFKTSINKIYADMLLREVKNEAFQEDIPDEPDYIGYQEKYYRDRFISKADRENQEQRAPLKTILANAVISYQKPLIRYYVNGDDIGCSNVTAYEGKTGFMMDWHQDIGDRSISETIIYLNDTDWIPEHGGEIEVAAVRRDCFGKVVDRNTTEIIAPRHGDVVILENLSPHFEHRVLPWLANNSRYSVIVIAGMIHKY